MLYSLAEKEKILSTVTLKLSKTNYKTQDLISYIKILNKDKTPLTEEKDSITGIKTTLLAGVQLYPFPARFGSYNQDCIYLNSTFKQPNNYLILG